MCQSEVPPHIPSGFLKQGRFIVSWLCILTGVYAAIYYGYLNSDSVMEYFRPGNEYCETGVKCSRSDLFAFQASSGIAITVCGLLGFYTWHISKRVHCALPSTPEGRLFGHLPESEVLAAVNFSFQFWDFFISLLIPEHQGALMLMHHSAAATICFFSLHYQVLHYYGVYFLGCTEFSSIFLVFIDLAKFFPPEKDSIYDVVVAVCGPLFALTFAIYRVILWWKVSLQLFQDSRRVISSGIANKLRPGKNYVLYIFLVLNIPLGILQLYWFGIILEEVGKVVTELF